MKGTPEQPRCGEFCVVTMYFRVDGCWPVVLLLFCMFLGFSKQVLQILSGYKFGSFDILTDEEVRQGKFLIELLASKPTKLNKLKVTKYCTISVVTLSIQVKC